jgi:hypothetical protein
MKIAFLLGFLFKIKLFCVNTRECISRILLKNQLQLKCIKDNSPNLIPNEKMFEPPEIPIEIFNVAHTTKKNNELFRRKGCDNRPYDSIQEYDKNLIKKYIKMHNILEKLKKQLDENKANGLDNDHSIYDKIPQLDTKSDIKPIQIRKGGLMKNYEGYIFTDW